MCFTIVCYGKNECKRMNTARIFYVSSAKNHEWLDRYRLKFLGSVQVPYHKGNDVLCAAMQKVPVFFSPVWSFITDVLTSAEFLPDCHQQKNDSQAQPALILCPGNQCEGNQTGRSWGLLRLRSSMTDLCAFYVQYTKQCQLDIGDLSPPCGHMWTLQAVIATILLQYNFILQL